MTKHTKESIMEFIVDFVKINGTMPTSRDLHIIYGVSRGSILSYFGNYSNLVEVAHNSIKEYLGAPGYFPSSSKPLNIKDKGIYIITAHQNNTKVNKKFLDSLLSLKDHLNAKLIVIPTFYQTHLTHKYKLIKNDQGKRIKRYVGPKWSPELNNYYRRTEIKLNEYLTVCANINVNATAVNPLSGFESITGISSCILGHPQVRQTYVPTPPNTFPKVMMSTGSISMKNYTKTRAGAQGAFHHTNAALVVYVEDDKFWPFIVNADASGGFYHLENYYNKDGHKKVELGPTNKGYGLVLGDLHCEYMDPTVKDAIWKNKGGLLDSLPITRQVWHDVIDFNIEHSHHNKHNLIYRNALRKAGKGEASWAVNKTLEVMEDLLEFSADKTDEVFIISSNHHDHIYKFLNNVKMEELSLNDQKMYLDLMSELLEYAYISEDGRLHDADCLKIMAKKLLKENLSKMLRWVSRNDDCNIYGIDVSQHGDVGPNGARGAIEAFAKSAYRNIIGHSHTPGIAFGTYQVGHSSYTKRNYNPGYSSWAHVECLIYPNGKRTLLSIIDGRWRPFTKG